MPWDGFLFFHAYYAKVFQTERERYSVSNCKFTVVHDEHPPITVETPIKWDMSPYGTDNWRHTFMSLRWLDSTTPPALLKALFTDFIDFHIINKYQNPYYNSRSSDFTTGSRVKILLPIRERLLKSNNDDVLALVNTILQSDIYSLQDPNNYTSGHNHGLMSDVALIKCYIKIEEFRGLIAIENIINRALKTLYSMFSEATGVTKEHSIFYQIFNFRILQQLCELMKIMNDIGSGVNIQPLHEFYEKVRQASKELASMSLRADHTYFPVGDTKIFPNWRALGVIFDCEDESISVIRNAAILRNQTRFALFKEGFCFFRGGFEPADINLPEFDKKIRVISNIDLVFLCGWHSWAHKQDDELSFILDYKGINFFDDAGYHGYLSTAEKKSLRDADHHSTITLEGTDWAPRNKIKFCRRDFIDSYNKNNIYYITGEHYRIGDNQVARKIYIQGDALLIEDYIRPVTSKKSRHRFILGFEVKIFNIDYINCKLSRIVLEKDGIYMDMYCIGERYTILNDTIRVVTGPERKLKNRVTLDFFSESSCENRIKFFISFDRTRLSCFEKKIDMLLLN